MRAAFLGHAGELLEVADVLEVGLPYSDPLGDGPTIQRASEQVLRQGMTTKKTFELIAALRRESDKAIVLMTYYNPVYCYRDGEAGFLRDLKAAGADGVILPDLPPEEADTLIPAAREIDLDTVFLVAPTSTTARLERVTEGLPRVCLRRIRNGRNGCPDSSTTRGTGAGTAHQSGQRPAGRGGFRRRQRRDRAACSSGLPTG